MERKRLEIKVDDVFVGMSLRRVRCHRRVIAICEGVVLYSIGTDKNRSCKLSTFQQWMRRTNAVSYDEAGIE